MNDAVVLLALSQLVCLGGLSYLYVQVMKLRTGAIERRQSDRVHALPRTLEIGYEVPDDDRVRRTPDASNGPIAQVDLAMVSKKMTELGVDVPALARRMGRSEDEIRTLLRRKGAA